MHRLRALGLCLALAACSNPLAPQLEFTSSPANGGPESATATALQGGTLRISGTIEVPNDCQGLRGSVGTNGGVVLTVRSTGSNDPACGTDPSFLDYEAIVQGLGAGSWEVTVVHAPQGVEEYTVLERQVTID